MRQSIHIVVSLLVCAVLSGCFQIGPAYPEEDGRKYLQREGYPSDFIVKVVKGEKLEHSEVLTLSKSKSTDVRFLLARNPTLTLDELEVFIRDEDDFVRSGAACNRSLSSNQIETLIGDTSHTVYSKLAGNAALSDETLLRIHRERQPGLLFFAMNPNCPDVIRQEVLDSNDSLAKRWLEIIDGWKKDGTYKRGEDSRWQTPVSYSG